MLGFGALVALMMLYEMEQWQKTIYIIVIVVLVFLGKRVSDNDRAARERDARRDVSAQNFKNYMDRYEFGQVVRGIQTTIAATGAEINTNRGQFKATIAANKATQGQEQEDFEALLQKETDLFNSQEKAFSAQHEEMLSTQEEVDATFEAVMAFGASGRASSAEIARVQAAIPPSSATVTPTSPPPNPLFPPPLTPTEAKALQKMGLQMAKEINDWIASVSQDAPIPTATSPGGWNPAAQAADEKADEAYVRTLESDWNTKFGGGPRLLIHQLHNDYGVLLTCTGNAAGGGPANFLGLCKACADRLVQGAMRLN